MISIADFNCPGALQIWLKILNARENATFKGEKNTT
jgi:hypothetical protein